MTGPIAKARNVTARIRRRQGSTALLRTALSLALIAACIVALPRLIDVMRTRQSVIQPAGTVSSQLPLGGLQSGACMSYTPTGSTTGKTVFLDPGHGGLDPGVVGSIDGRSVLEKDASLAVANDLSTMLRGAGYRVVVSRTEDSSVAALSSSDSVMGSLKASAVHRDLVSRVACANAANASVLVSIHFDAFDDPSVGGTETFYDSARQFVAANRRLAQDLQTAMVSRLGTADRGVWTDDQLVGPALTTSGDQYGHLIELGPALSGWVDTPSQMPGALVEPLFLTDPNEARIAADPAGQKEIAEALNAGLQKYFRGQ